MRITATAVLIVLLVWIYLAGCGKTNTTTTYTPADFNELEQERLYRQQEMGGLLSGWMYDSELIGLGDYLIEDRLKALGAHSKVTERQGIPDIKLKTQEGKGEGLLWVRYRNREHFIQVIDNPDFDAQFAIIVLDAAIIRLGEKKEEIKNKLGK